MNELQIIQGVECYIDQDGVVQLNLEHVARGLGFVDDSKGKEYVRWNTVRSYLKTFAFSQEVAKDSFIPEPIFYLLAMKADNETARKFQHTVAYEILPSIRKHGVYAVDELLDNPDIAIQAFQALKEEREKRKALESENAQQKQIISEMNPKVTYHDLVLQTPDVLSATQIAKDYGKSAQWLNGYLHDLGIQFKQGGTWLLYQKYAEQGYTKSKTETYSGSDGAQHSKLHTYWTQKGRLFLYDLLKQQGILPLVEREQDSSAS